MQMDHQIAIVKPVFRLRVEGGKVIFWLAFARHHADIVTPDQRIQPGDARQRGFRRHQPELGLIAQGIFHIGFDAGANLDFIQVLVQGNILDGAHLNPLKTDGRSACNDAVGALEVNGDGIAAILVAGPD